MQVKSDSNIGGLNPINQSLINPFQSLIKKQLRQDEELDRLSNETFYNPFDVLYLGMEASDEDIKKMFMMFSRILHPDKCKDPRAGEAFQIVDQSYKTLMDPDKRKVYIRVMREAREKTEYDRNKENKKRAKFGQAPLPNDTFEADYKKTCQALFAEIEDRKKHLIRLEQSQKQQKLEEYERRKMLEQYKVLNEEEWEQTREERVSKWRQFVQQKSAIGKSIGTKQSDKGIRPPLEQMEIRSNNPATKSLDGTKTKFDDIDKNSKRK